MTILFWFLLAVLIVAVGYDLVYRVIPNWLTLSGFVLALILSFINFGWNGFAGHLIGALITGGVWFVFWQSGIMGGGDQKLMMAVGALLGKELAIPLIFFTAIAGGCQALIWIGFARIVGKSHGRTKWWKNTRLPYSIAIAAGAVLTLYLFLSQNLPLWLVWNI